jgi:hypothetical protein
MGTTSMHSVTSGVGYKVHFHHHARTDRSKVQSPKVQFPTHRTRITLFGSTIFEVHFAIYKMIGKMREIVSPMFFCELSSASDAPTTA